MQQYLVNMLQITLILLQTEDSMLQIKGSTPRPLSRGSREIKVLQIEAYLQHPLLILKRIETVLLQVEASWRPGKPGLLHIPRGQRLRPEWQSLRLLVLQQISSDLQHSLGVLQHHRG